MQHDDTASTNPVRDAALGYAAKGWPVLAVDANTGAPFSDAPTIDRAAIIEAWIRWPLAAVAVVLGYGLVALRAPVTETATRSLARLEERCGGPGRPQVAGAGDSVWLYRYEGPRLANREVAPGVHLLGDGVVVLPPSLTPRGVARWRKGQWYADRDPDQLPEWLHRLATQGPLEPPDVPPEPAAPPPPMAQAARAAYYDAAALMLAGKPFKTQAAVAKLVSSEAAMDNARPRQRTLPLGTFARRCQQRTGGLG